MFEVAIIMAVAVGGILWMVIAEILFKNKVRLFSQEEDNDEKEDP